MVGQKFYYIFFLILIPVLIHCSREVPISEEAHKKEKQGEKSEALYHYSRALEINPNYSFANKRVGFLLSESPESQAAAIFHLETARRESANDIEISLKLFDVYLLNGEMDRVQKLRGELTTGLDITTFQLIDDIYNCFRKKDDAKNIVKKFISLPEIEYGYLFYRSWGACFEFGGYPDKSKEVFLKYKNPGSW